MNIYWLDRSPVAGARYHSDLHLRMQIVILCQILCAVAWEWAPKYSAHNRYPRPSTSEYREGRRLITWTGQHALQYNAVWAIYSNLLSEYKQRTGREHSCGVFLHSLLHAPRITDLMPATGSLPPLCVSHRVEAALGMDEGWVPKTMDDIVLGYRMQYVLEHRDIAHWTNRGIPEWYRVLSGEFGLLGRVS